MPSKDDSLFDWDETSSSKRSRFSDTSSITRWKRTSSDLGHGVDIPECGYDKRHVAPAPPGVLMPILFGPLFLLIVALSVLASFGLAAGFIKLGGFLLEYKAEIAALYVKQVATPAFAQVVAVGCAVANGSGCILALLVAWLLNNVGARCSWELVFFSMVVGLSVVAGAFVTAVGLFFPGGHFGPNGLSVMQALKAGPLGFSVVAVAGGLLFLPLYLYLRKRKDAV